MQSFLNERFASGASKRRVKIAHGFSRGFRLENEPSPGGATESAKEFRRYEVALACFTASTHGAQIVG